MRSAGYSSLVSADLPQLLRDARKVLECEHGCDSACQGCLLTYDTRFRVDSLDRKAALRFLTTEWVDSLALPQAEQLFGTTSQAEYQPVAEAITRELNRSNAKTLYAYLNGNAAEWDLPASPLRRLLHRLSAKGDVRLCLVATQSDLSKLSTENVGILNGLATACDVDLRLGSAPPLHAGGRSIATVEATDGNMRVLGLADLTAAEPTASWGRIAERPVVVSPSGSPTVEVDARPLPNGKAQMLKIAEISHQLDGPGSGFGERFWKLIGGGEGSTVLPTGLVLESVSYEDRYLATPVACALLVEVLSALKIQYEQQDSWGNVAINVATSEIDAQRVLKPEINGVATGHQVSSGTKPCEARSNTAA